MVAGDEVWIVWGLVVAEGSVAEHACIQDVLLAQPVVLLLLLVASSIHLCVVGSNIETLGGLGIALFLKLGLRQTIKACAGVATERGISSFHLSAGEGQKEN